jgi:chorismate synthase
VSGIWGKNIKLSIFGESHGSGVGIVIDGLKAGLQLDFDYIKKEMKRRAPGQSEIATQRTEQDNFKILSGYFNEYTTGAPLCAFIENNNTKTADYDAIKELARPSHADYTGFVKFNGFNDYRGGGHFSGRLTAALLFAGAVCKQQLEAKGIVIGSHIKSIYNIEDNSFDKIKIDEKMLQNLNLSSFPVLNKGIDVEMKNVIIDAKDNLDSVGGIVETAVLNLKPGLGDPFFDSFESKLSHLIFSIPGVKGVEFGEGFEITRRKGSIANDEYYVENGTVQTFSNNNGGILGGITNGMPVVFRTGIKPTPSISKTQRTINLNNKENTTIEIHGRHDPCIVPRAIPVIEAVTAICIMDLILENSSY